MNTFTAPSLVVLSILLMPSAGAVTRIAGTPDFSFTDSFETDAKPTFWSDSTYAYRNSACPGSSTYGNSLLFKYYPDTPEKNSSFAEQRFDIPNSVQLEISYSIYVPENYVTSTRNHKNFFLWSGAYGVSNSNISLGSESWPNSNGASPSLYIGEDGNNYGHAMNSYKENLYTNNAGQWIDVHIYAELADEEGDYGVFNISKNGYLINGTAHPNVNENYGAPDISNQVAYSSRGNYISSGYLLGWANGGFSELTEFCIDNFSIKANETIKATVGQPEVASKPILIDSSVIKVIGD